MINVFLKHCFILIPWEVAVEQALFSFSPFLAKRKYRPTASGEITTSKMAAATSSLVSYGSDSDSENDSESNTIDDNAAEMDPDATAHLKPLQSGQKMSLAVAVLNSAPEVAVKVR